MKMKQLKEPWLVATERKSVFSSALWKPAPANFHGIQAKITCYLNEDVEWEGVKMLAYGASCQTTFLKLTLMVCRYLAIPVTSASSERVYFKGRQILCG